MSDTTRMEARRIAGVSDRTWPPPPAPDDAGLANRVFDWHRTDWPAWVTSAGGYETGSKWRLTRSACIVLPEHCRYPTLALTDDGPGAGPYRVDAGTILTLVETSDPDEDEAVRDLDMINYYMFVQGWAMRTYRIEDGPSAGVVLRFSADRRGDRFPFSSRIAHAAIVPVEDTVEGTTRQSS